MVTGREFLDKLLRSYRSSFDVEEPFDIEGDIYDAHASFTVTSAKYVLIKKAELWRADCFEHVFFRICDRINVQELGKFRRQITDYIEPELVRKGAKWPEKNHMYTYITAVYICENGLEPDVKKALRRFRFEKNYLLTIRGYSQARVIVFDLKERQIYGNPAARQLVKGYKKAGVMEKSDR